MSLLYGAQDGWAFRAELSGDQWEISCWPLSSDPADAEKRKQYIVTDVLSFVAGFLNGQWPEEGKDE